MSWRSPGPVVAATLLSAGALAAVPDEKPASPAPVAGAASPAPRKRPRVVSDLSGFELLDEARLKDKPMVAGATRVLGARPPVLLAPLLGKVHGTSPVFAWRHEGTRFAFILYDEAGTELYASTVEGRSFAWPRDRARLADGTTYLWSVKAAEPEAAPAATAGVLVVTPGERARIDAALAMAKDDDPYRAGLLRAQVFVDARVWYDALAAYDALVARFPDRPEGWERRATLLAQLPTLGPLAEEDFARADALTSSRR